jgi:hypothetical protein
MVSVSGAIGLILKTVASPVDHFGPKDVGLIGVSAVLGIAQAARYVMALLAKTPIKDKAKQHIRKYRIAQGWKPEGDHMTRWGLLQLVLWNRLIAFLSPKNY